MSEEVRHGPALGEVKVNQETEAENPAIRDPHDIPSPGKT
jgi:hypothetical protein